MNVAVAGTRVEENAIVFALPDVEGNLEEVRLHQEIERPRDGPPLVRRDGVWTLTWPRPAAARVEYKLELVHRDGTREIVCDPTNPRRAPGPFGDRSVVELPDYQAPAWTDRDPLDPGEIEEISLPAPALRDTLQGVVWRPGGIDGRSPLPLLVVHDGPEFAAYSSLLRFLALAVEDGRIPPLRAALLGPVDRNHTYSASAAYSRTVAYDVLPALARIAPSPPGRRWRAGMGASLGALALLHAHRTHPTSFGALFLQSGSFFRQRFDRQESDFVRFRRISRFVGTVLAPDQWAHPIPVAITCGTVEENLANNRAMRAALRRQGYDTTLGIVPDAHNWTAWRDALDPHLVRVLHKAWG